jgi:DNA mismatch repair protein MutL
MPDIVRLLPDSIANQIAAGEVVQRPASVVKELMENAIDAGSRRITLLVRDAGKSLIQVIDDGSGMSVRDARMSFERHATSKIRTADDLFAIRTMGFRGEALASIAAVAQVEMRTRLHGEELGTLIAVEGSEVLRQEFTACAPGTGIAVKNLFFNVPARRNFLKSNPVELRHILEEFQRVAIAQPDIEFSFFQNDIELHHLQPSVLSKRLAGLFGAAIREQLVPCEEETSELSLRGYIGKPESAKKSRGDQYFFVNNRYIRSPYLQHAVVQAYEGLIAPDQFPFFVIFIDIDPAHIDVNVHPTKTEIKFLDERTVYALLKTAVRSALGKHHVTPALDFGYDTNFHLHFPQPDPAATAAGLARAGQISSPAPANLRRWEHLFDEAWKNERFEIQTLRQEVLPEITPESQAHPLPWGETPGEKVQPAVFQIGHSYLAAPVKSGLMLIDQAAAHERILYERYMASLHNKTGNNIQQCLFPERIELNPSDALLVKELESELKSLGFDLAFLGAGTFSINGIPSGMEQSSPSAVFQAMLEEIRPDMPDMPDARTERLVRAMARQAAVRSGKRLGQEEMLSLINQLFSCSNANYTPGGKAVYCIVGMDQLDSFFNKS